MERRALVVALALTLPLVTYGIPYAYAVSTQSTYIAESDFLNVAAGGYHTFIAQCSNPSDYTQKFAIREGSDNFPSFPNVNGVLLNSVGNHLPSPGDVPNGWQVTVQNTYSTAVQMQLEIICQSAVTLPAGIGVPEFGSFYVAIALGAVVYFMMSRRFARRPTMSGQVKA
jgi:hypothetical protein